MGVAAVTTAMALSGTIRYTAQGQDAGKPIPVKAMAKEANPDWEVATVKASAPNDTQGQHIGMQGQHVMLLDTTVEQFLLLGYGVQQSQLAGEPEWVKTTRWDVNGVSDVEGQPSWRQLQGMIRKILVERFGLQLHHANTRIALEIYQQSVLPEKRIVQNLVMHGLLAAKQKVLKDREPLSTFISPIKQRVLFVSPLFT
jgi:hypothetical protein